MNVLWNFSQKKQIEFYIISLIKVCNKYFQERGIVLLPYFDSNYSFLPDYKVFENKKFRKIIEETTYQSSEIANNHLKCLNNNELISFLKKNFKHFVIAKEVNCLKKSFKKRKFINFLKLIFINLNTIKTIEIIPVKFGTKGSFLFQNEKLFIFPRIDFNYENIYFLILRAIIDYLYSNNFSDKPASWKEKQKISEFIFTKTKISQLISNPKKYLTLENIKKIPSKILNESLNYFAQMGYPVNMSFIKKDKTIYYKNKEVVGLNLSCKKIFFNLIKVYPKTINDEDIAKILWGKDWFNKFSDYAISKKIQEIRDVLEQNNISRNLLVTIKKEGYKII